MSSSAAVTPTTTTPTGPWDYNYIGVAAAVLYPASPGVAQSSVQPNRLCGCCNVGAGGVTPPGSTHPSCPTSRTRAALPAESPAEGWPALMLRVGDPQRSAGRGGPVTPSPPRPRERRLM